MRRYLIPAGKLGISHSPEPWIKAQIFWALGGSSAPRCGAGKGEGKINSLCPHPSHLDVASRASCTPSPQDGGANRRTDQLPENWPRDKHPHPRHRGEVQGKKPASLGWCCCEVQHAKSPQAELKTSKKREILPMEGKAIFHGERREALLPNARSVNDLGKPPAQEYNC